MAERAGSNWRLLVHDMEGRKSYGKAHNVVSDKRQGLLPTSPDPADSQYERTLVIPNTEFDELVVGKWIHVEQMNTGRWWVNIGGVTVQVIADRRGRPRHVSVYGPGSYAEPVDGCEYELAWSELPEGRGGVR